MDKKEITAKVRSIICDQMVFTNEEFDNSDNLRNDLGADSLDEIELIMEVEKEFDVPIPDRDAEGVKTVQDIINLVEKKIA